MCKLLQSMASTSKSFICFNVYFQHQGSDLHLLWPGAFAQGRGTRVKSLKEKGIDVAEMKQKWRRNMKKFKKQNCPNETFSLYTYSQVWQRQKKLLSAHGQKSALKAYILLAFGTKDLGLFPWKSVYAKSAIHLLKNIICIYFLSIYIYIYILNIYMLICLNRTTMNLHTMIFCLNIWICATSVGRRGCGLSMLPNGNGNCRGPEIAGYRLFAFFGLQKMSISISFVVP